MRNKLLFTIIILLILGGVTLTMIHSHNSGKVQSPPARTGGHPSVKAPGFVLKKISGDAVSLEDFQGKVLVINFFATWCPPCKEEVPGFVKIFNRYKGKGLEVLGISLDDADSGKDLPPFLEEHKVTYTIAFASKEVMAKYGGVQTVPTTFFINRKGDITNVHIGFMGEKDFEAEVQKLL